MKMTSSRKWIWIFGIIIVIILVLLTLSFISLERISCIYENDCPENYQCYSILSGGLGPEGPLPVKPIGGDLLCHKSCNVSADCPFLQACKLVERQREDYVERIKMCFPWLS